MAQCNQKTPIFFIVCWGVNATPINKTTNPPSPLPLPHEFPHHLQKILVYPLHLNILSYRNKKKRVSLMFNAWNLNREVDHYWNFIKIIWFLHHLIALNERIWEWAYFLNLAKQFRRYLNFSAPKNKIFLDKT